MLNILEFRYGVNYSTGELIARYSKNRLLGNKYPSDVISKLKLLVMLTDFFNELPDDLSEEKYWLPEDIHKAMEQYNAFANRNYYMNLKTN